ncbi:MAG TPA: proton-conducting transporter membrane subunit, partial [Steroidobacteraceae bacterium]|nr:proton-conducting transporter membrane subunit [Steroidobacteraceae bacterium]
GLTAGILHMFVHALAKGTLFLAVAALALRFSRLRLEDLAGAGRQMPWTMAAFVIAGLSLIGIPGTAGFISKWLLISAVLEHGALGVALVVMILVSSLLAAIYVWRVVETAYLGGTASPAKPVAEAPLSMLLVLWVAALANIFFGLAPSLPTALASQAASILLRHGS